MNKKVAAQLRLRILPPKKGGKIGKHNPGDRRFLSCTTTSQIIFSLLFPAALCSFQQLDPRYQVLYGNPQAEHRVVEYYSLSCPKCLALYQKEFPNIQKDYLEQNNISWSFHPSPTDLLTLQEMVCLEKLESAERKIFLETILESLTLSKGQNGCPILQAAMEALGKPMPDLDKIDFLAETEAFHSAGAFLMQKDVFFIVPTVEIDGTIHDVLPDRTFLDTQLRSL
jgi:hypothetical protein